jgi:hypothetical protein
MNRRSMLLLTLCTALAAAPACERLPERKVPQGRMALASVALQDSIPADYGRLVAVTSSDAFPGWAQLWFERPDQSIVTVFVDFQNGEVRDKILLMPRGGES